MLDTWRSQARAQSIGLTPDEQPDYYLVGVTFDQLTDPAEKTFFQNLPTTLTLPDDAVDRLTAVGGSLLRQSPEFQRLLGDLAGTR
jgi:NTE family protein